MCDREKYRLRRRPEITAVAKKYNIPFLDTDLAGTDEASVLCPLYESLHAHRLLPGAPSEVRDWWTRTFTPDRPISSQEVSDMKCTRSGGIAHSAAWHDWLHATEYATEDEAKVFTSYDDEAKWFNGFAIVTPEGPHISTITRICIDESSRRLRSRSHGVQPVGYGSRLVADIERSSKSRGIRILLVNDKSAEFFDPKGHATTFWRQLGYHNIPAIATWLMKIL